MVFFTLQWKKYEKEEDMNYIDVAENECLLIIVLRKMLIIQMSEDEVGVALSIGINTFDLADIYG